jgi:phage protein D
MPSLPKSADRLYGLSVRFNGVEKPELYKCAETFRVTEEIGHGSTVHLVVMLCRKDDGSWPHLDEAEMGPWQRVTVTVTVGKHKDVLMDGYISHIQVEQTPQTATLRATFTVVDVSYVMGLKTRCKVWPAGQTYEDIAKAIITNDPYKLQAVIETNPPQAGSDEPRSVVQRSSDLQFLRELARRRGYEFYVMGATAYFRKPVLQGTPQKAIASNFGERTNCEDLHIFVDGTAPMRAVAARIDPYSGESVAVAIDAKTDCGLTAMGTTDVSASRDDSSPIPPTTLVVRRPPAMSEAELKAYLCGLIIRTSFFVKATGTLNALRYGAILRTRKTVKIFGYGKIYTGTYYVRRVVHTLTPKTYHMEFEAYRNRTGQIAPEDASVLEDPSKTALPLAAGDGADTDVVKVAESGRWVAPP